MQPEYVNYCPTCRAEREDGQSTCLECGGALDLARKTVTPVDISNVDMRAIHEATLHDMGLTLDDVPHGVIRMDGLECVGYEVLGGDDRTHPL